MYFLLRRFVSLAGLAFAGLALAPSGALAQNTGGVFGPVVNEGHALLQYRATYDPDTDGLAQRLHFERALNGEMMWRIVAQARRTDNADIDFDFVQGELFWQLTDDDKNWQSGVRFDGRIRDEGRPGLLGVNWINQIRLSPQWSARFIALSAVNIGADAPDGVFIQTRAHLAYRLPAGHSIGVEVFNAYGSTADFRGLDEQSHQIGPFAAINVTKDFQVFAGALIGLTGASADQELRLWFTKSFN